MTEAEFIDYASELSGVEWRNLAAEAARFRRRAGASQPQDVPLELLTDDEVWERIRRRVAARRGAKYRAVLKERHAHKREERRSYMRQYMARYRSRTKEGAL